MAKKKAKLKATRAPGGGRKSTYGEPTVPFSSRLPESVVEIMRCTGNGNATAGLIEIVKHSVQYLSEKRTMSIPVHLIVRFLRLGFRSDAMVPDGQLVCVWPDDVEKTDSRFAAVLEEFSRRKQSGESREPLSEDEVRSVIVANDGNDSVGSVVL